MIVNENLFKETYPQFSSFEESIKSDIVNDYFISVYNKTHSKNGNGNFVNFVINLMSFANSNSVQSIKQILTDKNFINELDELGHTLYILAFARYNGTKYIVKASSKNKYDTKNYIVNIEND